MADGAFVYVEPHEAMEACADRLETLSPDDGARAEVLALYSIAAPFQLARIEGRVGQADGMIPMPYWLCWPTKSQDLGEVADA